MSILIKNVLLYNIITDILIEGNKIKTIAPNINVVADKVIDGTEKAAVPGFVNCHTHAGMIKVKMKHATLRASTP